MKIGDPVIRAMYRIMKHQNPEFWKGYMLALRDHDASPACLEARIQKEYKKCRSVHSATSSSQRRKATILTKERTPTPYPQQNRKRRAKP